jgi:hypothetical protein
MEVWQLQAMKLFLVVTLRKFWKYVLFNEKVISTKKSSLLKNIFS